MSQCRCLGKSTRRPTTIHLHSLAQAFGLHTRIAMLRALVQDTHQHRSRTRRRMRFLQSQLLLKTSSTRISRLRQTYPYRSSREQRERIECSGQVTSLGSGQAEEHDGRHNLYSQHQTFDFISQTSHCCSTSSCHCRPEEECQGGCQGPYGKAHLHQRRGISRHNKSQTPHWPVLLFFRVEHWQDPRYGCHGTTSRKSQQPCRR